MLSDRSSQLGSRCRCCRRLTGIAWGPGRISRCRHPTGELHIYVISFERRSRPRGGIQIEHPVKNEKLVIFVILQVGFKC